MTAGFAGLDPAGFLARHWQKRPLLVRSAFPDLALPITPEELAGLACEADVESRMLVSRDGRLEQRDGPFDEDAFAALPETEWTLLVHEVDRHVAAVARLLDPFRFLPNWRIDDVMVSYAAPGGGVGAHVDRYDVFLIQGLGRRRWSIERHPSPGGATAGGPLARFEPDEVWELDPGDMLYLPPSIPHHGVALDACMTFSVGFRAPGLRDLAAGWLTQIVETAPADRLYADPALAPTDDPGRVDASIVDELRRQALELVDDARGFGEWFGRFVSTPARAGGDLEPEDPPSEAQWLEALRSGAELRRSSPAHFVWTATDDGRILHAGGRSYGLDARIAFAAPLLCGPRRLDRDALADAIGIAELRELVDKLVRCGLLVVEPADAVPQRSSEE